MLKRLWILMLLGSVWLVGVMAQDTSDLTTFTPRTARFTFDYPVAWVATEENGVIALADSDASFALELSDTLSTGQFKVLLAYLSPAQREAANLRGETVDQILQSVIANSNTPIASDEPRRYEFNRRQTMRADFVTDGNEGGVWVMEMDNDAVILLQVFTATGEMAQLEGQLIELLRSVRLTDIMAQLYGMDALERPLQFTSGITRLVFNYPEGWTVTEPTADTVLLEQENTQISVQFFDYTDLSLQGIPIDDPAAILDIQQSRSSRPDSFGRLNQVTVNGNHYPYSRVQGDGFTGLSLGRDFKVGFLWVTLLTAGDTIPEDDGALAWSLLLNTTYRPDAVNLTERVIMPQHQFEFFYPAGWLIREVTPSSFLLGTSEAMIDRNPDSLQFTDDAQLLIQYVTPSEYGVARAGTANSLEVLQKFITSASDLTTYDRPRSLTLGNFDFAQVDFDNPSYSGTALLAPMVDGGAVWIQLRTPPNELGEYEPIALAMAQRSRIVTTDTTNSSPLTDAVFDALGVEPTPVPTPTRRPDAPPDLGDVVESVVATPVPANVRRLTFELPALTSSYTTNISQLTANYPAGWLVQETVPLSDPPPLYENSIRLANNPNLLLANQQTIEEGHAEVVVQALAYTEMDRLGFRGETLLERVRSLVTSFPQGTFDAPLQFLINGDLMILVTSTTPTRQTLSIYRELNEEVVIVVQLSVNPAELEQWLPTAVAILQSAHLNDR